jgi:hypothetical protein
VGSLTMAVDAVVVDGCYYQRMVFVLTWARQDRSCADVTRLGLLGCSCQKFLLNLVRVDASPGIAASRCVSGVVAFALAPPMVLDRDSSEKRRFPFLFSPLLIGLLNVVLSFSSWYRF